jgi:anti-sigma factor RsiW
MTCRDIEPLITAYVDGESASADKLLVTSHLDACAPCRLHAERQAAARTVLRARASHLNAPPAPAALRARCRPAMAPAPRRAMLPWALAASVIAAAVVLVTLTTKSTTVLAAQLTVDHLKCFEFPGSPDSDFQTLETNLTRRLGWSVMVPPGSLAAGLTLLTARRCLYADGKVAHLMYRHHNRPVSLFVLPASRHHAVPLEEVKVMGHEAVVWSANQKSYVLIGREPRVELEQLAAYVQKTIVR